MEISNQALTSSLPRGGARVRGGVRVRGGGVRVRGGLLGVAGNVGINGIQTLNQVHDEVFIDEVNHVKNKRSNPSLDRRRCVENLEKAVSRLVEVCGISVVACFHNQAISKLEIIGDNKTIDNLDDGMRKALDNALALSYQNGSDSLHYVNLRKYQTENPNLLSELDKVNACHLPKTDFKLISEKEQFINSTTIQILKKHSLVCLKLKDLADRQVVRVEDMEKRSLGLSGIMMTFTLNVPGPKLGVWKNLKIGQEFGHILCMT